MPKGSYCRHWSGAVSQPQVWVVFQQRDGAGGTQQTHPTSFSSSVSSQDLLRENKY